MVNVSAACADYRHARFAPVDVRDVEREPGGARGPDHLLAAVADRQHGLVLDFQLGSVGLGRRGNHGWGPLNRLLDVEREPDFSRREAERRLLRLIRVAHLPEPRRNVRLHGYEVDLYWPEQGRSPVSGCG